MGFSLSAAAAIIGVSILLAIEMIVSTTVPTFTEVHDSYDKLRDRSIEQIQTDINITNVETYVNGSNYDHNITVENTGSVSLVTGKFDILINGTSYNFECSKAYLYPESEAYFNVTNLAGSESKKLKIVTNNGISDYYEYTIP